MSAAFLGIDIGTTVVKAGLYTQEGEPVGLAQRPTPNRYPAPSHSEMDMAQLWDVVCEAVAEAAGGHAVTAISFSGISCGAFLVDASHRPVRPAILWNDGRAADLIAGWQADGTLSRVFERSGNVMYPGYTVPVLAWLQANEPESLERAAHVLCCKDWVRLCMTGEVGTDPADASYMPFDLAARQYDPGIWEACGVERHARLFPPVHPSDAVAGTLQPEAAGAMGLEPGIPVASGMCDVAATTLGAGVYEPGEACSILGTSCLNSAVSGDPDFEPRDVGINSATVGGRFVRSLVNTAGTMNVDWFAELLCPGTERGERPAALEAAAREVPPGARGVVYLPYLNTTGVVSPFVHPHARAVLFGLSVEHGRAEVARAIFEGVAMAIRDCYEHMSGERNEVRLVGGGARSDLWCQLIADCVGLPVRVPDIDEPGALGAAVIAARSQGVVEDPKDMLVHAGERRHEPQAARRAAYDELFGLYRELSRTATNNWTLRNAVLGRLGAEDG